MRRRGSRPSGVTDAMEGLLAEIPSGGQVRESLALAYWAEVVGPQAAAASEVDSVRDGTLIVRTKSSVWSQELSFLKGHILTELNRKIGRPIIHEIVFRAQGLTPKIVAPPEIDYPTEEELNLVVLPSGDQAALVTELESLSIIHDEKLRSAITRRIVRDRKLRRWRMNHGWKRCSACTALHNTDEEMCPICRLRQ